MKKKDKEIFAALDRMIDLVLAYKPKKKDKKASKKKKKRGGK